MKVFFFGLLATLIVLLPASAFADRDMIGLYADESANECGADTQPYVQVEVYVIANLSNLDSVSAAEFSLDNYPGGGGIITADWNSTLIIGDLETSFAIAFVEPLTSSTSVLGRLQFMSFGDSWPGEDYTITIGEGERYDTPVIVDSDNETVPVLGGRFTFNCSSDANCACGSGGTADQTVSSLKQTY